MKKSMIFTFLILLSIILTACLKEAENQSLNKEMIEELKNGKIVNTPLRLDRKSTMTDVEKEWGKPHEHHDHEDIQTYVYVKNNKRFVIAEDELKQVYRIGVELNVTKSEIEKKMGKPTNKSGKILSYHLTGYIITFEKMNEHTWNLNLLRND
ncbi:DUF4309 domain-containing protein [Pseudalkalibacillus sp. A8]|uniref:DUF4309 domain-containing protein n=1 Tax=Pseudalkalibacillus sp. A8 TaxID=3382641 RepID=UPI0038B613F8